MAMKNSLPSYNAPAEPTEPSVLRESCDFDLPDWSGMEPLPTKPPVAVAFEQCEQWLQALPNRRQIRLQRANTMCPVEFRLLT